MTVAQLKQHLDRRFDHLERTKADKSDLARFVTKDDLKAELKRFATKDDLKAELKRFTTKDDVNRLATRTDYQFGEVFRRLDSLNDKIDSLTGVVRDNRDLFDRVSDEYGHRIADLEHDSGGYDAGVPKA